MRAHDIEKFVTVGRPTIAPDGTFAVFATSRPDVAADRNVGQLWCVDLPDGAPRRITRGVADRAPQLSPDGSRLGFLRADAAGTAQIFVADAAGGEPAQATDAQSGVDEFAWSPDGRTIAYTARVAEQGRYGTVVGLDPASESPRRITGVRWHANGLGYIADRPTHVFVVDAPDPGAEPFYAAAATVTSDGAEPPAARVIASEARALSEGPQSHHGVVFTADGSAVLTVVDEIESERRDLRTPILALPVDGSAPREVLGRDADLSVSDVAVAPDGVVALLGYDVGPSGVDLVAPGVALHLLDGRGVRRLSDPETIDLGEVGSHITALGEDFLVQNRVRGRVELVRVSRSGQLSVVLGGDLEVGGHAAAGESIVASAATADSAGELVVAGRGPVTDFARGLREVTVARPREVEIPGRDGYPVHGWVATPEGDGPFPVILQIHGGPYASYGIHLFDETQVLVDAGYAVVYCNPRGSAGYGRAHGRSIRQAMGTVDFHDVLDFLDTAIDADTRLDGARVGIMGGSYGGYLTAWTVAHEHRFRGAIVERGFLDPVTFQGTSDIGSFFGDEYLGIEAGRIAAQSPMAVVGQVRTPTLVIHSELDFRCPLEQATRYYTALRRQGTPAELLVFPGEDHELTRSGRPRHRIERFEAVLDWWARHLPLG